LPAGDRAAGGQAADDRAADGQAAADRAVVAPGAESVLGGPGWS